MKKSFVVLLMVFLMFSFANVVNADGVAIVGKDAETAVFNLKNGYDKRETITVESSEQKLISVYGKSNCSSSEGICEYTYFGYSSNVNDYLKKHIVCSGGEKNISYSVAANASSEPYKGVWTSDEDVEAYWREDYYVKCYSDLSNNTLDNSVKLENTGTSNGTNSGDYPSSGGTVDNEDTGVFTYYAVLLAIALGSYILLLVSKKHNLFKKI